MEFTVSKASNWDYAEVLHVNTLEELKQFIKTCDSSVVIDNDFTHITIYDDYLE